MVPSRKRMLRYILWFSLFSLIPFLYLEVSKPVRYVFKHSNISGSCVIPRLDPFHPSIMQYMIEPQPLTCDSKPSVIFIDANNLLQFNTSALKLLNIQENDLKCTYRVINRNTDDVTIMTEEPVSFIPPFSVKADTVRVNCAISGGKKVQDKLMTNIAKNHTKRDVPVMHDSPEQLSVILFGLDSVSRSAAIRKLPKTVQYLTEQLQAYDFKGYVKVGENTLPNLMALLTGLRCWSDELPHADYANKPYDEFPFLWKNFSDKGYATFYAEDLPDMSTFSYLTRGFVHQPTDHYMRPFWLAYNDDENKYKINEVFRFLEDKKVYLKSASSLCYQDKPKHLVQMDHLRQFIQSYKNQRRFALSFLVELSHDYQNFLTYGDNDVVDFLKWLKDAGHLDTSILVLFSDHGSRIEKIRNTPVGRIEDRMPMLYIVLPPALKSKYPNIEKALRDNENRLTVAHDVHQTVLDVLNRNFDHPTRSYVKNQVRGISLFQPVPIERSCQDAWIPEQYCPCYTSVPLTDMNNPIVQKLALQMVADLNARLVHLPECVELTLSKIRDVRKVSQALEYLHSEQTGLTGLSVFRFMQPQQEHNDRYEISIEVLPSKGIFEGTYDMFTDSNIKLVGDILRTNKYGDQSACITDKLLKPLCYCKNHMTSG